MSRRKPVDIDALLDAVEKRGGQLKLSRDQIADARCAALRTAERHNELAGYERNNDLAAGCE